MSELAKRVRAARAWADMTQKELGDALGLNEQSVKRTEAGTRDPGAPEQWAIAEITGVPRWFITEGFPPSAVAVDEFEAVIQRIGPRLAEILEGRVTLPAVDAPPEPPGELGRRIQDQKPNGRPQEQPEKPSAADEEKGTGG